MRDVGSIPESGRSPGGGHGHPLQYSCWSIPWTEQPDMLQSVGLRRVGHDSSDLAPAHIYIQQLGHKTSLKKCQRPEIIQGVLLNHNGVKLKLNNRKQ